MLIASGIGGTWRRRRVSTDRSNAAGRAHDGGSRPVRMNLTRTDGVCVTCECVCVYGRHVGRPRTARLYRVVSGVCVCVRPVCVSVDRTV